MPRDIALREHTSVTNEHWEWQRNNRRLLDETEPNTLLVNAIE